jgi:hypothetical protein
MNYIAAEFQLDFDHARMEKELLEIPETEWLISTRNDHQYKSLFLTVNNYQVFTDFKSAKTIKHSDWKWNPLLNIPYTKSVVDLLPKTQLGMVRAMWTNGPLPMHVDSNDATPNDLTYLFGITLAPVLHEPMTMLEDTLVYGKAVIFDDSKPHGFPKAKTNQLGIRIFGDFLYEKFRILRTY